MKILFRSLKLFFWGSFFMSGVISPVLHAQGLDPSLSLFGRHGITPYEYIGGFGGGLQFDYPVSQKFYLSGGAGYIGGKSEVILGEYSYFQKEKMGTIDLIAAWNLTPNQKRNKFGIGLGGSLTLVALDYAKDINLPMIDMQRHRATIPMINLVLEETFFPHNQWGVTARFIGRSSLSEKAILERNSTNGTPSTIGGVRNNYTFDIGLVYRILSE